MGCHASTGRVAGEDATDTQRGPPLQDAVRPAPAARSHGARVSRQRSKSVVSPAAIVGARQLPATPSSKARARSAEPNATAPPGTPPPVRRWISATMWEPGSANLDDAALPLSSDPLVSSQSVVSSASLREASPNRPRWRPQLTPLVCKPTAARGGALSFDNAANQPGCVQQFLQQQALGNMRLRPVLRRMDQASPQALEQPLATPASAGSFMSRISSFASLFSPGRVSEGRTPRGFTTPRNLDMPFVQGLLFADHHPFPPDELDSDGDGWSTCSSAVDKDDDVVDSHSTNTWLARSM